MDQHKNAAARARVESSAPGAETGAGPSLCAADVACVRGVIVTSPPKCPEFEIRSKFRENRQQFQRFVVQRTSTHFIRQVLRIIKKAWLPDLANLIRVW